MSNHLAKSAWPSLIFLLLLLGLAAALFWPSASRELARPKSGRPERCAACGASAFDVVSEEPGRPHAWRCRRCRAEIEFEPDPLEASPCEP